MLGWGRSLKIQRFPISIDNGVRPKVSDAPFTDGAIMRVGGTQVSPIVLSWGRSRSCRVVGEFESGV